MFQSCQTDINPRPGTHSENQDVWTLRTTANQEASQIMESHYQRATKSLVNIFQHHVHVLGTVSPQENLNPAHIIQIFLLSLWSQINLYQGNVYWKLLWSIYWLRTCKRSLLESENVIRSWAGHLYLLQLLQSLLQLLLQSFILRAQLSAALLVCTHHFFALLQQVLLSLHSLLQGFQKFGWITIALSCPRNKMQR